MKEEQVNIVMYITDDGKKFDTLESAQEHENHIKALEKLKTFKIDGPNYTPFDDYKFRLLAYDWQWYKVHDQDELQELLVLAADVYAMKKCSDDSDDFNKVKSEFYHGIKLNYGCLDYGLTEEQRRKFPKYIAISFNQKCITTLDSIEKRHKMEMEKWKKFYQAFKNDLKKDMENF